MITQEANENEMDLQPACSESRRSWFHHQVSITMELANHDALFPVPSQHGYVRANHNTGRKGNGESV